MISGSRLEMGLSPRQREELTLGEIYFKKLCLHTQNLVKLSGQAYVVMPECKNPPIGCVELKTASNQKCGQILLKTAGKKLYFQKNYEFYSR